MKVAFAILHYDPAVACGDPAAYLARVPIHRELPRELARLGHQVVVVHTHPFDHRLTVDGVRHEFVASGPIARLVSGVAVSGSSRDRAIYEPAWRAINRVRDESPDLIHFHGMTLTWNLALLLARVASDVPVVLHFHGGGPARHRVAREIQACSFRRANAFLFTTRTHSQPYVNVGLIDPSRVVELLETSSTFELLSRDAARHRTRMTGDPVFVWTGRLAPVKDPLTALKGFALIAATWRSANLYLYFLSGDLLDELREFVSDQPGLAERVHFRGPSSPGEMENIYNSADFFLQASRREVCGQATLEAMACGVIPIVTDIPSFQTMTCGGAFGVLFPEGDDRSLAAQTLSLDRTNIPATRATIRQHFERVLSFPAMARQLDAVYRRLGPAAEANRDNADTG